MGEKELFNFGDTELNINSLLNNINANQQSYLNYYSNSISDSASFIEKVNYIKEGIKNGSITTDGTGAYYDTNGKLSKDDQLMNNALHYVDIIAKEQSKKTRSLTKSEIEAQKQEELGDKTPETDEQPPKKDFDPENPFNFEYALKSQFGPSLEIPYNALKNSITKGEDGLEDYSTVKSQFQNAFNSIRTKLNEYNNSETYINQINNLETALFDGVWDYQDELAIHQVGLNGDLNNLKELFTYKLPKYNARQNYKQSIDQVTKPGDFTVIDGDQKTILYLDEEGKQIREQITDDEYYQLSGTTPVTNPTQSAENVDLDELENLLEEDQVGWEVIGPIGLDIISIVDPEPVSATVAGLGSDALGIWQDVRNGGDFHWGRHGANIGATLLGAIPYIGDAGNVVKVGNKIVEASTTLNKFISNAKTVLDTLSKYHVKGLGAAGTGALALMDLTSEDSVILDQGKKALDLIKNGEITAENVAAVGNAIAITMQLRKGWKKFRSLDPNAPKTTKTPKTTSKNKPNYRDSLTTNIKTKNPKISDKDLNAIQGALDRLSNQGVFARARSRFGKPSEDYLKAQKLLREKGHFSESEISDILKQVMKHEKGGVIKASTGMKTPWRLNFDGTSHQMEDIYKAFTDNLQSYDSKQMSDALNKLNSEPYIILNFENSDNTLGFKDWNTTFNESGLNNLFGYNESKSDYLGVTTRSRKGFVDYLKNKGIINTGNGTVSWNPTSKQWEYKDWVDKSSAASASTSETPETPETSGTQVTASQGNAAAPTVEALTLKQSNLKKPVDFNAHGVINSLVGYIANEVANAQKRKIQKEIPIYQEIAVPEKSFRTPYTYDLEKAKNEIMADANSIQPITSDASAYYAAKNEAIKNARAYTSKLDTTINDIVHQANEENKDIAFENAVRRTDNANTNAKYRHEWDIEQKQGDVDYIEASNQSFQALNKEFKHNIVTEARRKQKQRDAYVNKHILTGITTSPSNYIDGWTKHHDLIWYKGQNNQLETGQEQIEYQQLVSIVNQAAATLLAQYENINYPGIGTLHVNNVLKESYDPNKHGIAVVGAKGMKLDKQKMGNFINKLK